MYLPILGVGKWYLFINIKSNMCHGWCIGITLKMLSFNSKI